MKMAFIEATDLNDAWFQALRKIVMEGRWYLITKGSREGIHRVGMPITIDIQYPGAEPLYPIMPEGSGLPAPTTQEDIEEYFAVYLMSSVRAENEDYTYGEDASIIRPWVENHYKEAGHGNNHGYITIGRPETVYFYDRTVDYEEKITLRNRKTGELIYERKIDNLWNKDPKRHVSSQCLRGIDTWIEDEKLHFWVYFRSWDLWGGFPVNLGGIQLMKQYMAGEMGVGDGSMIVSCKDLHVYEDTVQTALNRVGIKKDFKEWLDELLATKN